MRMRTFVTRRRNGSRITRVLMRDSQVFAWLRAQPAPVPLRLTRTRFSNDAWTRSGLPRFLSWARFQRRWQWSASRFLFSSFLPNRRFSLIPAPDAIASVSAATRHCVRSIDRSQAFLSEKSNARDSRDFRDIPCIIPPRSAGSSSWTRTGRGTSERAQ